MKDNNNNNNNNQDNVYGAVIMNDDSRVIHCESSPDSRDECRTASDGCLPLDQADGFEPLAWL